jgi:hypothetical protein
MTASLLNKCEAVTALSSMMNREGWEGNGHDIIEGTILEEHEKFISGYLFVACPLTIADRWC